MPIEIKIEAGPGLENGTILLRVSRDEQGRGPRNLPRKPVDEAVGQVYICKRSFRRSYLLIY
jgi:hypothetical protein